MVLSIARVNVRYYYGAQAAYEHGDPSWRDLWFTRWKNALVLGCWPETVAKEVFAVVKEHFPAEDHWLDLSFYDDAEASGWIGDGERTGYEKWEALYPDDEAVEFTMFYNDADGQVDSKLDAFFVLLKLKFS